MAKTTKPKQEPEEKKEKKKRRFFLFWLWLKNPTNLPLVASLAGATTLTTGAVVFNAVRRSNNGTPTTEVSNPSNTASLSSSEELFTVSFDTLGEETIPDQEVAAGGYAQDVPFQRVGYDFLGWYTSPDAGTTLVTRWAFTSMPITEDITFYASMSILSFNITFNTNGGTSVSPMMAEFGAAITAPTPPSKTGYTFGGWFSDEALLTPFTFTVMPSENITLYAKWLINQYTITFEVNGGSQVASVVVDHGQVATRPADPTREGYQFNGWYEDQGLLNLFVWTTTIEDNLTLYAGWAQEQQVLLASGRDYVLYVNKDGELYGAGYLLNTTPVKIQLPAMSPGEVISKIYASFTQNFIITSLNRVLIWAQTNNLSPFISQLQFTVNPLLAGEYITSIHTGNNSDSTYLLSSQQRVFVLGPNDNGIFNNGVVGGIKSTPELLPLPTFEAGETITTVNNLGDYAFLVTSLGNVYGIGANSYGNLGLGTTTTRETTFKKALRTNLNPDEKFVNVSGADGYVYFLTNEHRVFVTGRNGNVNLGLGTPPYSTPTLLTVPNLGQDEIITKVGGTGYFGILMSNLGKVYFAGFVNLVGYTNVQTFSLFAASPVLLEGETIVDAQSGNGHLVALTSTGRVLGFAGNGSGQLAIGNKTNQATVVVTLFGAAS
jgi:uncharacterized repeat protein (TIGR02543 family)